MRTYNRKEDLVEKFVDFMSGKRGQSLRIVVGAVLVLIALTRGSTVALWVFGILGILLILSGVFKVCVFNLLVGRPINACPKA